MGRGARLGPRGPLLLLLLLGALAAPGRGQAGGALRGGGGAAAGAGGEKKKKTGVLFVCLGNICRSPTAEAMFTAVVQTAGRAGERASHASPDLRT